MQAIHLQNNVSTECGHAGAASIAVKYGSLLSDLPFQPSAAIAVSFIVVPTLVFSAVIAAKSSQ